MPGASASSVGPALPPQNVCHMFTGPVCPTKRVPHVRLPRLPNKSSATCLFAPLPSQNVCQMFTGPVGPTKVYHISVCLVGVTKRVPHARLLRCLHKACAKCLLPPLTPENVCHMFACPVGPTKRVPHVRLLRCLTLCFKLCLIYALRYILKVAIP